MSDQTITTDTNHDALTGRAAGENITIQQGAVLTIDSMPQHTAMGILGDLLLTKGEINIDGRSVREIAYSSGSGSLPVVGTAVSWGTGGGAGTGKIIRLNSGDYASGVMTITVQSGANPNGTITDGSWSATVDTDEVGLLMVFGEDQVWDATDATCIFRVRGDWYEIGVGTGLDNQVITLPHTGVQHAVWVETASGSGIYQIWHRVSTVASTAFWDAIADWGSTYESGFVFDQTPGSSTLTFGTSTNGGAPPSGAKIRIPNVHIGTTTVGAPFTEYTGLTLNSYLEILDSAVNEQVYIDHLNASSCQMSLVQVNGATISDSCFGLWNTANIINRVNGTVSLENCAFITGNGLTGETPVMKFIIQDNLGGITITDCVFYAGVNENNGSCFYLLTMAGLIMEGTNKIVSNQQDENTMATLRGSVASVVDINGTLISLNGPIYVLAGCVDWDIELLAFGQLASRGSTENTMAALNATGVDSFTVHEGRLVTGGATVECFRGDLFVLTDSSNVKIRNFGSVTSKIDRGGYGDQVVNIGGITNNCLFQRLYFTNAASANGFLQVNSCADCTFENCSSDYDDEIEPMSNRCMMKGIHGGSGNIGAATGVEDDYPNVLASIFYDIFKSDTTGGVGLVFNDRGQKHLADVTIDSGNPQWNGIGDLLMPSTSDQVTFEFPYWIKGHTGFQNVLPHLLGVNAGTLGSSWGNFDLEYALDTGSGYGSFKAATGANLSGESISPTGFRIKIRIKVNTANSGNLVRGLQIHTTTTLSDQASNLYPLETVTVAVTVRDAVTKSVIQGARVYLETDPGGTALVNELTDVNGEVSFSYGYEGDQDIIGRVRKATSTPLYKTGDISGTITATGFAVTVYMIEDE
jgi:hypothetical protein